MTKDHPFDQALLYLRAAGHDTGAETRARVQYFVRLHRTQQFSPGAAPLLAKVPQWFDLPDPSAVSLQPPVTRGSVGYPDE